MSDNKTLVLRPSHIISPFLAKAYTLAVSGFTGLIGGEEGNLGAIAPHEPRPLKQQPQCEIRLIYINLARLHSILINTQASNSSLLAPISPEEDTAEFEELSPMLASSRHSLSAVKKKHTVVRANVSDQASLIFNCSFDL